VSLLIGKQYTNVLQQKHQILVRIFLHISNYE